MQLSYVFRSGALFSAICLCLQAQSPQSAAGPNETKGMPPRATPADYQAHTQVGAIAIAAEFTGHSVPSVQGPLTAEDFVVVEVGLFGSPGARVLISATDFTLRINGKKFPLPSQPFGLVAGNVKDPEWEPPAKAEAKTKTSVNGGGEGEKSDPNAPPEPVKIPIGVLRAMAQRVQKAALPEGDRILPQAGLIFFQYRGKVQGIHSIELIYSGPAGKASLALQP
jgi:hypothetical protein